VRIDIDHPEHGELAVVFADQRTFGSLAIDDLVPTADGWAGGWGSTEALVPSQVAHIGRDPSTTRSMSAVVDACGRSVQRSSASFSIRRAQRRGEHLRG
jgi:hypothetical protein